MAGESTRKRSPKRKAWSADDFVDAVVGLVQHQNHIGRGNAIRLLLGRPLKSGIIDRNGEMVTTAELAEVKAWILDSLFRVYGDRLARALAMMAQQKQRGQLGAAKRKAIGAIISAEIVKHAEAIRRKGSVSERNLAGVIAKKMDKHHSYIRKVLKKARQTQG